MSLFDSYAMFEGSMTEKLRAWLPFCCSIHSATAACEACEHAHRVRWPDGATGLCHRSRCRGRTGCCFFLCCSRCRFEFSCRYNRSDADRSACYSLLQASSNTDQCFSDLCMRLCRCGRVARCCFPSAAAQMWASLPTVWRHHSLSRRKSPLTMWCW